MFIRLREKIARKFGRRVASPFRVPLGWVDIYADRVGVDIDIGCTESCFERLSSYPFKDVKVLSVEEAKKLAGNLEDRVFDDVSMDAKKIADALAFLYIVGEIKESEVSYEPLRQLLPELKMYGLATSYSLDKLRPVFFASLSSEGYRVAKRVVAERLETFEDRLWKLSSPLSSLIALGMTKQRFAETNFSGGDLQGLLMGMKKTSVPRLELAHPKAMLAEFLVATALNGEASRLARKLERMGLAFKVKTHSPSGYEIGEEYRIAREAIEFLLKASYADVGRDLLAEFLAAYVPLFYSDVYPVLRYCGDKLKECERKGLCELRGSRVILKENFEEYARVRLAMVADAIIRSLS
ncbi:MAG: hypothetical protein ABWW66_03630 [Archaeoglobaceae archaeon]